MRRFILAVLLVFGSVSTSEGAETGNELLAECNLAIRAMDDAVRLSTADGIKAGGCLGLMQGITTLSQVYQHRDKDLALFCLPSGGVTNAQAARVVVSFLRDNPSSLHNNGSLLAIKAFMEAFPCADG